MSSDPLQSPRERPIDWHIVSTGKRRRVRDARLAAFHVFERGRQWQVLGLHQDLSRSYPVEPLLGAASAQAELALTGEWKGWRAVVASVLVRTGMPTNDRRHHDTVVQLTTLDIGAMAVQFTARHHGAGFEVALLTRIVGDEAAAVITLLSSTSGRYALRPGDRVAANEVQIVHTRQLHDRDQRVDIEGPLDFLAGVASSFGG